MDQYDSYTSDAVMYSTLFLVAAWTFAVTAALLVISWVLIAIPLSAVFRKAGIEPWKAWVPFYSTYTWLRLGGQSGHWVWLSLVPCGSTVTAIMLYIGMFSTGKAFAKDSGFLVLGIFLPWVWLFILGFGRDEYRPELIAAAGLPGPLEGRGARVTPDGITAPVRYAAMPYAQAPSQAGWHAPPQAGWQAPPQAGWQAPPQAGPPSPPMPPGTEPTPRP
jgi:hypothetical protein